MAKTIFGSLVLAVVLKIATANPVAQPAITSAPNLMGKRASSCTFSGSDGASSASASQKSCSTIVLSAVAVPSGTTLDLSDLEDDTTVRDPEFSHLKEKLI
jgi:polygalacturonase